MPFDYRILIPPKDVYHRCGDVSRDTIRRWILYKGFPQPVYLNTSRHCWYEDELEEWLVNNQPVLNAWRQRHSRAKRSPSYRDELRRYGNKGISAKAIHINEYEYPENDRPGPLMGVVTSECGGVEHNVYEGEWVYLNDKILYQEQVKHRFHMIQLYELLRARPEFKHISNTKLIRGIHLSGGRIRQEVGSPMTYHTFIGSLGTVHLFCLDETAAGICGIFGITCFLCSRVSKDDPGKKGARLSRSLDPSFDMVQERSNRYSNHHFTHSAICAECADEISLQVDIFNDNESVIKDKVMQFIGAKRIADGILTSLQNLFGARSLVVEQTDL